VSAKNGSIDITKYNEKIRNLISFDKKTELRAYTSKFYQFST